MLNVLTYSSVNWYAKGIDLPLCQLAGPTDVAPPSPEAESQSQGHRLNIFWSRNFSRKIPWSLCFRENLSENNLHFCETAIFQAASRICYVLHIFLYSLPKSHVIRILSQKWLHFTHVADRFCLFYNKLCGSFRNFRIFLQTNFLENDFCGNPKTKSFVSPQYTVHILIYGHFEQTNM